MDTIDNPRKERKAGCASRTQARIPPEACLSPAGSHPSIFGIHGALTIQTTQDQPITAREFRAIMHCFGVARSGSSGPGQASAELMTEDSAAGDSADAARQLSQHSDDDSDSQHAGEVVCASHGLGEGGRDGRDLAVRH